MTGVTVPVRQPILSRRVAGVLGVIYVGLVVFIVMWPSSSIASFVVWRVWWPLNDAGAPEWVTPRKIEFALNILLFVPLSFLGSTFRPRWGWTSWLLAGLLGTTVIEVSQLVLLPDRSASGIDILANTLGALAGYALVLVVRLLRGNDRSRF